MSPGERAAEQKSPIKKTQGHSEVSSTLMNRHLMKVNTISNRNQVKSWDDNTLWSNSNSSLLRRSNQKTNKRKSADTRSTSPRSSSIMPIQWSNGRTGRIVQKIMTPWKSTFVRSHQHPPRDLPRLKSSFFQVHKLLVRPRAKSTRVLKSQINHRPWANKTSWRKSRDSKENSWLRMRRLTYFKNLYRNIWVISHKWQASTKQSA